MAEIQSESTAVIGNRELREDMLHKLKKEFDIIHEAISKNQMAPEKLKAYKTRGYFAIGGEWLILPAILMTAYMVKVFTQDIFKIIYFEDGDEE